MSTIRIRFILSIIVYLFLMRGKKTAQLAYRLSEEEKAALTEISNDLCMKPAEIVSIVIARFVKARQQHGNRLIWPPEFTYFSAGPTSQDFIHCSKKK